MAIYINNRKDALITSVEFTPTIDGNFSFFRVKDEVSVAAVKEQLASFGESVIAETKVDGKPMLVVRGKRTDYSTLNALEEAGEKFKIPEPKHAVNPWKLRGWASMIGQPLQLVSSFLTKPKGIDAGVAGFASLNLIANVANIAFGAEESKDVNQLRYLKKRFNYELSKYLPEGSSSKLPSSYDDRMHLRQGKEKPPSFGAKAYNFIKRNSVSFCEIGLRYAGAAMLIFPMDKFRDGFSAFGNAVKIDKVAKKALEDAGKKYKTPSYSSAFVSGIKAASNSDKFSRGAGIAYVLGKSLAFTTQVPDPYDQKPPTLLKTVREKVVFPLSSGIEAVAAGLISYNSLFKKRIQYSSIANKTEGLIKRLSGILPKSAMEWHTKLKDKSGSMPDLFGGIGGLLFTAGLVIRMFAPYGHKEVDMNELNAHLTDGLAQVPREKLPSLIADFSAYLNEHFKGKVEFGEVYKQLTDGLYKYHQIALPGLNPAQEAQMSAAYSPTANDNTGLESQTTPPVPADKEIITGRTKPGDDLADSEPRFSDKGQRKSSAAQTLSKPFISHADRAAANTETATALRA